MAGELDKLPAEERRKQEAYRDARFSGTYDDIWQSVGKCVFCDLNDKYVFFEENGIVMTVSLFAYIDGHFMIVPRRHIRSPKDLTQQEWDTVRKFIYIAKKLIKSVHGVKGMQLVQKDGSNAQSTVDQHLHFHCIPFDAPDLSVWNYRKLQYTPLESASLYRSAGKKIIKSDQKYIEKYEQPTALPIYVDAVIIRADGTVLFEERTDETQTDPPRWTIPGGRVDNLAVSLEAELVREINEETALSVAAKQLNLHASRIGGMKYVRRSKHLSMSFTEPVRFLWNSYIYELPPDQELKLVPGDDCKALHWLNLDEVNVHPHISPEVKELIREVIHARTV